MTVDRLDAVVDMLAKVDKGITILERSPIGRDELRALRRSPAVFAAVQRVIDVIRPSAVLPEERDAVAELVGKLASLQDRYDAIDKRPLAGTIRLL